MRGQVLEVIPEIILLYTKIENKLLLAIFIGLIKITTHYIKEFFSLSL